jgi:hypothetical protein
MPQIVGEADLPRKPMPTALGATPSRLPSRWKSCCFMAIRKSWTPTSRTTSGGTVKLRRFWSEYGARTVVMLCWSRCAIAPPLGSENPKRRPGDEMPAFTLPRGTGGSNLSSSSGESSANRDVSSTRTISGHHCRACGAGGGATRSVFDEFHARDADNGRGPGSRVSRSADT